MKRADPQRVRRADPQRVRRADKRAQPTAGKNLHFIVWDDRTADDESDEELRISWVNELFQTRPQEREKTKQVQDKWHEQRNSDITVDQMLGRSFKRELFPVEENDRHEVNVHSKNDKNILTKLQETNTSADTVAPNFKVTLTQAKRDRRRQQQRTLTGSWMCQL